MKTHTFMMSYSFESVRGHGSGYDISVFPEAAEALTRAQVQTWITKIRTESIFSSLIPISITPLADD